MCRAISENTATTSSKTAAVADNKSADNTTTTTTNKTAAAVANKPQKDPATTDNIRKRLRSAQADNEDSRPAKRQKDRIEAPAHWVTETAANVTAHLNTNDFERSLLEIARESTGLFEMSARSKAALSGTEAGKGRYH